MTEYKWRVLYVEDQPEMVELIQLVLRSRSAEVRGAYSAAQAIEMLQKDPPDLVLLDLMMPEVDGWAVHHAMMADPRLRNIPIIVITARGSLQEREKGLRTEGIFDYFIKPFSPSELLVSVDRLLAHLSQKKQGAQAQEG